MNSEQVKKLKVAIVDDFLTLDGGAQKVLRTFHEIWPDAPVYTTVYFPDAFNPPLKGWDIRTSFIQKLPFKRLLNQQYKLFYQIAMELFNFDGYDLVLSSTYAGYAKGVIVPPETLHVSYVHNVPRFLWGLSTSLHHRLGFIYRKIIMPPLHHFWRIWDRQSAERPDFLVSNSDVTAGRVKKFYRRDSDVIRPPVEVEKMLKEKSDSKDYFVYFGRIEDYKRIDLAIKACASLKASLKIIGDGSSMEELKSLVAELKAEKYVEFLGRVSDKERNRVVAMAKASIFPCPDEEFGIVPVESMALGTPVIAFKSGGVVETVVDGVTGILIGEFSQESLNKALRSFDPNKFSVENCRDQAKKFSKEEFKKKLTNYIARCFA